MNITLLNGEVVAIGDIYFNPDNYSFTIGNRDITRLIYQADKRRFDGFDVKVYNEIVYVQNYQKTHGGQLPPNVGSESVWANFVDQITTDPLAAPLETLSNVVDQVFSSTGVKTLLIVGGGLLILVILAKR